jgi:hypothetical protein
MGMNRRAFIQGTALVAATPILANVMSLTTSAQSNLAETMHQQSAEPVVRPIEFKVRGWHEIDNTMPACETTSSTGRNGSGRKSDQVLISVNQSWRTAWR